MEVCITSKLVDFTPFRGRNQTTYKDDNLLPSY